MIPTDRFRDASPGLRPLRDQIAASFRILRDAIAGGGKRFLCGNGGRAQECHLPIYHCLALMLEDERFAANQCTLCERRVGQLFDSEPIGTRAKRYAQLPTSL